MFDFSKHIQDRPKPSEYETLNEVLSLSSGRYTRRIIIVILIIVIGAMFLPWTQNFRSKGYVIALKPEQRPQAVQSVIDGQIAQWYVQEGDFVEKGDTLIFISEVKEDYLDPELLKLTKDQLNAKQESLLAYQSKIDALESQLEALEKQRELSVRQLGNELRQTRLKLVNDSIRNEVALKNVEIARNQLDRAQSLENQGLRSLTELENRKLNYEIELGEQIGLANDLEIWRSEIDILTTELSAVQADFDERMAKVRSELYATQTDYLDNLALTGKMQNMVNTYQKRSDQYYLRAPQTGYVTQALRSGVGEIIKSGTDVLTIMPDDYDLAVEMYVKPVNLPLIEKGTEVRIQFDGWPAVVFSGWPGTSFGTFSGRVLAIDNFISPNGQYRVVVQPDPQDRPWPKALRVGSGTRNIVLLKDVRVWYEIWRQLNGFPPDFYSADTGNDNSKMETSIKQTN
ncbi:MAG: HlyD family efflux transporter periplasmic adaptor subunit [Saprospiraceae bacterium]|nr:HlyD family efflux transporter periplasmic adaptor subunit [Saprospiraceae bacterium]